VSKNRKAAYWGSGVFFVALPFVVTLFIAVLLVAVPASASQKYDASGVLLRVDRDHHTISVSCNEIPGYMDAMVMDLPVRDPKMLEGLTPGMKLDFSLVVEKDSSFADNLRAHPFESLELDPTQARRFKLMERAMDAKAASADVLQIGQPVPDFALTDQDKQRISLSQLKGKVVAITFIYTRCPRPEYCVRLSNNFGVLERRFKNRIGKDLILLTVVIDPANDRPEAMAKYARTWHADSRDWHFLTGPITDIQQLCRRFDMAFYPDEALLVHSFHTALIDPDGRLAANLEGNDFTSQQLGDLVQTILPSGKQ
jgi:protein SCO1/2